MDDIPILKQEIAGLHQVELIHARMISSLENEVKWLRDNLEITPHKRNTRDVLDKILGYMTSAESRGYDVPIIELHGEEFPALREAIESWKQG